MAWRRYPSIARSIGQPGSRLTAEGVLCFHQTGRQLDERFGDQDWFLPGPFLNPAAVEPPASPAKNWNGQWRNPGECPAVERIWTRGDLLGGSFPDDPNFPSTTTISTPAAAPTSSCSSKRYN